jgi:hypothetical protein
MPSSSNLHFVRHYDNDEPYSHVRDYRPRILVVGDDPEALQIAGWLHGAGFEVTTTEAVHVDVAVVTRPLLAPCQRLAAAGVALLVVADPNVRGDTLSAFLSLPVAVDHVRLPLDQHDVVGRVQSLLRRQTRRPVVHGSGQARNVLARVHLTGGVA